jgi:hypothetical protein
MPAMISIVARPAARTAVAGALMFTLAAPAICDIVSPDLFVVGDYDDLALKAFLATSGAATDIVMNTISGEEISFVLAAPDREDAARS